MILHIGLPKTGTTYLQTLFAANRSALAEQGIYYLCVPITSSTSCDQPIFVDHATDVSVFSDAVQVEIDWLG